jgi:trk system potassium uptake protein TrkA
MKRKKFAVIGLGNFGSVVAEELLNTGGRVVAIDLDRGKLEALPHHAALEPVMGDATDRDLLASLEVSGFESMIVSTGRDSHASILIALYLKELGARNVIVKATSRDHAKILLKVGATQTVIPEREMAAKLARSIAQPNLLDFLRLTDDFLVAEISPPDNFRGKTLAEIELRSQYGVQAIAIRQGAGEKIDFVPGGQYRIGPNDVLVVVGRRENIEKLRQD